MLVVRLWRLLLTPNRFGISLRISTYKVLPFYYKCTNDEECVTGNPVLYLARSVPLHMLEKAGPSSRHRRLPGHHSNKYSNPG